MHCLQPKPESITAGKTNSPAPNRRILTWSASIFFVVNWLVPIIPVENSIRPLSSYIPMFGNCLAHGYLFAAAGYCLLLLFFASITCLSAIAFGWLIERAILLALSGQEP